MIIRLFLSLIILFVFNLHIKAQWTQSNGPYGGNAQQMVWLEPKLLVSVGNSGIFLSEDTGENWFPANNGFPENSTIWDLKSADGKLFSSVGTDGIYMSLDSGATWTPIHSGIEDLTFYAMRINGSEIYAGEANGGVYYSSNLGESWENKSTGVSELQFEDFAFFDSKVYAGSSELYSSANNGDSWEVVEIDGFSNGLIRTLLATESHLYAGTDGLIFISENGTDWTQSALNVGGTIASMEASGDSVYLTTDDGLIYYTTDHWVTWETIQNNSTNRFVKHALFLEDKTIMTTSEGVYASLDNETWDASNTGINGLKITALGKLDCYTYAGTESNGLYFITEDNTWTRRIEGLGETGSERISDIVIFEDSVFIAAGGSVYASYNDAPWELAFEPEINTNVESLEFSDGIFMATVNGKGVYISEDTAQTWSLATQTGLNTETSYFDLEIRDDTVVLSTHDGEIFVSEDFGESWSDISIEGDFTLTRDLILEADRLYAGTSNGLFYSEDLGSSWEFLGNSTVSIFTLQLAGSKIFAGSIGVYEIDVAGGDWTNISEGLGNLPVEAFAFIENKVFAGTFANSVWQRPVEEFNLAPEILEQLNVIAGTEDIPFDVEDGDFLVTDGNICQDSVTVLPVTGNHYTVSGKSVIPDPDFAGTLKVNVVANDGITNSENYEIEVEISGTNDVPEIVGQSDLSTLANTELEISLNDIEVVKIDGIYPDDFTLTIYESSDYTVSGNSITPGDDISEVFSVPVSVNDGQDESEVFNLMVSIESILKIEDAKTEAFYPNPFQTSFTLNIEGNDEVEIRIFNMQGSEVLYLKQPVNKKVDASELLSGVYLLEVTKEGDKIFSQKIIKE